MKRTKNKNSGFNVLCMDPSLTAFGFAVVCKNKVLFSGCIKTVPNHKKLRIRVGDDRASRVSEINHILKDTIKKYKIAYLVAELPHGSQNDKAAVSLGLMTGIVQSISDYLDMGLEWWREGDDKKAALGKQSATKQEMIDKMTEKYRVEWPNAKYKKEAIADALAIHYVANRNSHVLKTFNR